MAEVQTSTESGEMAQRFIELVMMQAQNAAYALGQIPHPETGEAPVNLDLARLFIDQLIVLRAKTRGNLSADETGVLNNAISNLQMAFLEVAKGPSGSPANGDREEPAAGADASAAEERTAPETEAEAPPAPVAPAPAGEESRKKFTKSYGA
jgi:hypothetical protein